MTQRNGGRPPIRFERAQRERTDLRLLLFGEAGSGKTYGAMGIANALSVRLERGEPFALIDADDRASLLYADMYTFDFVVVGEPSTDQYIDALDAAAREGYRAVVLDGLTQHWQWLRDWVDREGAKAKGGNRFAAWAPAGEQLDALIDRIRSYPGHVIATARGKERYRQEGGNVVTEGFVPEVRESVPAMFDVVVRVHGDHAITVTKSRCCPLDGLAAPRLLDVVDTLTDWLAAGITPASTELERAFRAVARTGDVELYRATRKAWKEARETGDVEPGSQGDARVARAREMALDRLKSEAGDDDDDGRPPETAQDPAEPARRPETRPAPDPGRSGAQGNGSQRSRGPDTKPGSDTWESRIRAAAEVTRDPRKIRALIDEFGDAVAAGRFPGSGLRHDGLRRYLDKRRDQIDADGPQERTAALPLDDDASIDLDAEG